MEARFNLTVKVINAVNFLPTTSVQSGPLHPFAFENATFSLQIGRPNGD